MVSLTDKAYDFLSRQKEGGESFSDVVIRISSKDQRRILLFAGCLADESDALKKLEKEIYANRKRAKLRTF